MESEKNKVTPRVFFLWLGTLISLYWSIVAFLALLFTYIDYAFTNIEITNPYGNGASFEMASLIVFFPTLAVLTHLIHREVSIDRSVERMWVRRWALFLTLFIAGVTVLIDLIVLLNAFLNGSNIVVPFILKTTTVFLVAGATFLHFLAELRGYWIDTPIRFRMLGYAISLLMFLTIGSGFFILGTPQHAHALLLDSKRIEDLQNLQGEIESYWQQNNMLPKSLSQLRYTSPTDPQNGTLYEYHSLTKSGFELCAIFNEYSSGVDYGWYHGKGRYCFHRSVTNTANTPIGYPKIPILPISTPASITPPHPVSR